MPGLLTPTLISVPPVTRPQDRHPCRTITMCPRSPGWATRFRSSGTVRTPPMCSPSSTRQSTDSGASFGAAINLTRGVIPAGKGYTAGPGNPGGPGRLCLQPLPVPPPVMSISGALWTAGSTSWRLQELTSGHRPLHHSRLVAGDQDRPHRGQRRQGPCPLGPSRLCLFPGRRRHLYQAGTGDPLFFLWRTMTSAARPQMAIGPDGKVHLDDGSPILFAQLRRLWGF